MIILLTATAVLITGVPLAAVALVTLASRHEEHARSIAGHAPGVLAGAARRLLGFRATGITRPACRATAGSRRNRAWLAGERAVGLLAGEHADDLLAGERADDLDAIGGPALAGGPVPLR